MKDYLGRDEVPLLRVGLRRKGSHPVESEVHIYPDGEVKRTGEDTPYDVEVDVLGALSVVQRENTQLKLAIQQSFSAYMACIADLLSGDFFTAPFSHNIYDYMREQKSVLYEHYVLERDHLSLLGRAKLSLAWDSFWEHEIPEDPFAYMLVDAGSHYDERQCAIALERVTGLASYATKPLRWAVLKRALSIMFSK